jgi:hypothetical protein
MPKIIEEGTPMSQIMIVVEFETKPEHRSQFIDLMRGHAERSRRDDGCLQFDLMLPKDDDKALRRLLGLGENPERTAVPAVPSPLGRSWTDEGVTLPHDTLVKMKYGRRTHEGQIVDGQWFVEGKVYDSPSGAAVGIARTSKGAPTHLNGWRYWYVKRPEDLTWISIEVLRKRAAIG